MGPFPLIAKNETDLQASNEEIFECFDLMKMLAGHYKLIHALSGKESDSSK